MRPEGPKIEAKGRERGGVLRGGQQAPPARGSDSDVNKTKFLRPRPRPKTKTAAYKTKTEITRPRPPEISKRHLTDLTFK